MTKKPNINWLTVAVWGTLLALAIAFWLLVFRSLLLGLVLLTICYLATIIMACFLTKKEKKK